MVVHSHLLATDQVVHEYTSIQAGDTDAAELD